MTSQSSYDRKVADAKKIVEEHNSHLKSESDDESAALNWGQILTKLKQMGGTTDANLREMSWEDLQDAGVPRVLARRIANNIFRKNGDKDKTKKTKPLTTNRVAALTFQELFENYDPTGEANSAVRDRLEPLAKSKRCVVFDPADQTKVLAEQSAKALRQLKDGMPEQESVSVGGKLAKLYRIGETPDNLAVENFLYPGRMLRDGVCDNTNVDQLSIPLEARQIVFLAITKTGEVIIDDVEAAHRVLDTLKCDEPVDKVQSRYGKAALMLQELVKTGDEPKLVLVKGGNPNRQNNPFNTGRSVRT